MKDKETEERRPFSMDGKRNVKIKNRIGPISIDFETSFQKLVSDPSGGAWTRTRLESRKRQQ